MSDFRIEYGRDASVHWHGIGKITHLPTDITVEFENAWNDRGLPRQKAMEAIRLLVKQALSSKR